MKILNSLFLPAFFTIATMAMDSNNRCLAPKAGNEMIRKEFYDQVVVALEKALGGELWKKRELLDLLQQRFKEEVALKAGPIFIPRAFVPNEARMGLTPYGIKFLRAIGIKNRILVEAGSGINRFTHETYFSDEEYREAGAEVLSKEDFVNAAKANKRKMVVSIKEPKTEEYDIIRDADVFTYLHLADAKELTEDMRKIVRTAIAYETILYRSGNISKTPVLAPASHGAGWVSALRYAVYNRFYNLPSVTETDAEKKGRLDALFMQYTKAYPGIHPELIGCLKGKKAVVLGGGVSGETAALALAKMGADVTITDVLEDRITELRDLFLKEGVGEKVTVLKREEPRKPLLGFEKNAIRDALLDANAIVGSILIPGAPAPKEVSKELYQKLVEKKNLEFIADIAIDQGGNFDLEKPAGRDYKYHDGWPQRNGICEFIVTNMPSVLPKQISFGLERAKLAYLVAYLMGLENAIEIFPELIPGVNIYKGHVANSEVARKFGYPEEPLRDLIRKAQGQSPQNSGVTDEAA